MSKLKNIKHRDGFTFFKSYDDVMQNLNDKQFLQLMRTILDVQFLRIKYENVKFNDNLLNLLWSSMKYNISSQVDGYLANYSKNNNQFMGVYDESNGGCNGGCNYPLPEVQGKVKEEVKGEDKVKVSKKSKSFFNLEKPTSFDNLSSEYIEKLKEKIESNNENIMIERLKVNSPLTELYTFEDFSVRFLSNGMKKKDWWMTFIQYQGYVFENESKRKGII